MRTQPNYDLRSENGCVLFLPPHISAEQFSLAEPDTYAASIPQKYPIGTLAWYAGIGKKYRYCQAGATLIRAKHAQLVADGNYEPDESAGTASTFGFYGHLLTLASKGDTSLTLNEDTSPGGSLPRAKNFYQGGHFTVYNSFPYVSYYVVASDLGAATSTKIYLDHPIVQTTLAINVHYNLNRSPYSNVMDGAGTGKWHSFIGRAPFNVTSTHFFWVQTAGPVWLQATAWGEVRSPGYSQDFRDVYAHEDGSIQSVSAQDPANGGQRIGYLLAATRTGENGSGFIMLQLES